MPRLTADLILRAPSRINPLKERELDLRGQKIPEIQNIGATQDQYDTLDFSDNEIGKLENFPLFIRLHCLFFNNNHISKIAPNLGESLPNLDTLTLTNNRLVALPDLDPLASFPSLKTLSLIDNVVSKKPDYRLYVIHILPNLKILDFCKIKQKERAEAEKLYGPPANHVKEKGNKKSKTFVPGEANGSNSTPFVSPAVLTEAQLAFKAAIANAKTIEQVQKLERVLRTGGAAPSVDIDMTEADA